MSIVPTKRDVSTPSDMQGRTVARLALPRALRDGQAAMQAAGKAYLPQEVAESDEAYRVRLARSSLFNAFGKTVADMTGRVFEKPVTPGEDMPSALVEMAENIDLTGRSLNEFAHDVFADGMTAGIAGILVDAPPTDSDRPTTRAEDKASGRRPYMTHVPIENVLGWKSETIDGAERLTQLRLREFASEPDGEFHEKEIEQVRVLERGTWRVFRKAEKGDDWILHARGNTSIADIPFVPFYAHRTGFMTARPPLEDLAFLNKLHWQSDSDQRNILHVARTPILFGTGFGENDELTIGANTMVKASDPNASLEYVEHTGQAIGAGRDDLKDIELRMQVMGLQLLVDQPGQTATGEARDSAKELSPLAMMAIALADALENAFGFMAQFANLGADGGSVNVHTDFGITIAAAQDVPNLLAMYNAGLISRATFWQEIKRRGLLSAEFDPDIEASRIDMAAPELDAPADPDDDEDE